MAAKQIFKGFTKSDALGVFRKAVSAGGSIEIDDKILGSYFDDFLANTLQDVNGSKVNPFLMTQDMKQDLGNGIKKNLKKGVDYDWNKVIQHIGNDFGYDLSGATKVGNLELSGVDKYTKGYHAHSHAHFDEAYDMEADIVNGLADDGLSDDPVMQAKRKINAAIDEERNRRAKGISSLTQDQRDFYTKMINDSYDQEIGLKQRTLEEVQKEFRGLGLDVRESAIAKRKARIDDERKTVNSYKSFGPFSKKKQAAAAQSNALDLRAKRYHAEARDMSPEMKRALSLLDEMDAIKNAGGAGIGNSAHDTGMAKKVLNDGTGKDGIGLWGHMKNHPVISTAAVVGGVWGVSEFMEEDDF